MCKNWWLWNFTNKMKERKNYRYRKVTPEILEKIKGLRASGMTHKKIGEKLKLGESIVGYWLNPETRKKSIERAKKFYKKLPKEQKRENERARSEYKQEYFLERYREDEEFRKRMIGYVQDSFKRRQEKWKKQGLCSICGRKREDKKYKLCEGCRKKRR